MVELFREDESSFPEVPLPGASPVTAERLIVADAVHAIETNPQKDLEAELAGLIASGEVAPETFGIDDIYDTYRLNGNQPLARGDTGNRAVVVTRGELDQIGTIDFLHPEFGEQSIEPEYKPGECINPRIILLPKHIGYRTMSKERDR